MAADDPVFRDAACAGRANLWSEGEAAWARARSAAVAYEVLKPLFSLCSVCPVRLECEEWAAAEHYSGVAAGMVWRNGRPMGHVRVRRRTPQAS